MHCYVLHDLVNTWKDVKSPALRAAPVYACEETYVKDAFRWLRDRSFEDWLTPAEPERSAVATQQEIEQAGYTVITDEEDDS